MADRGKYEVIIGGVPHVMQYAADEAKRLGLKEAKAAPEPANKARAPRNKSGK